jgi:hypothetical protein
MLKTDKILPDYRLLYADLTIPVCRRTSRSSGRAPELGIIFVKLGRRMLQQNILNDFMFVLQYFLNGTETEYPSTGNCRYNEEEL